MHLVWLWLGSKSYRLPPLLKNKYVCRRHQLESRNWYPCSRNLYCSSVEFLFFLASPFLLCNCVPFASSGSIIMWVSVVGSDWKLLQSTTQLLYHDVPKGPGAKSWVLFPHTCVWLKCLSIESCADCQNCTGGDHRCACQGQEGWWGTDRVCDSSRSLPAALQANSDGHQGCWGARTVDRKGKALFLLLWTVVFACRGETSFC